MPDVDVYEQEQNPMIGFLLTKETAQDLGYQWSWLGPRARKWVKAVNAAVVEVLGKTGVPTGPAADDLRKYLASLWERHDLFDHANGDRKVVAAFATSRLAAWCGGYYAGSGGSWSPARSQ